MRTKYINDIRTVDLKFHELCNEIDFLKQEMEYWKNMYEELNKKCYKDTNVKRPLIKLKKGYVCKHRDVLNNCNLKQGKYKKDKVCKISSCDKIEIIKKKE